MGIVSWFRWLLSFKLNMLRIFFHKLNLLPVKLLLVPSRQMSNFEQLMLQISYIRDNQNTVQIAHIDVFYERTKPVNIDYHFVRHHLLQETCHLYPIKHANQLAEVSKHLCDLVLFELKLTSTLSPLSLKEDVITYSNMFWIPFFLVGLYITTWFYCVHCHSLTKYILWYFVSFLYLISFWPTVFN